MSVVAVDIGSSRTKALLAGWDGRLVEMRSAPTPRQSIEPGEVGFPAEAVLAATEGLIAALAVAHPRHPIDRRPG